MNAEGQRSEVRDQRPVNSKTHAPFGQWISASTPPDSDRTVIICVPKWRWPERVWLGYYAPRAKTWHDVEHITLYRVIAWMELPEPCEP